MNYSRIYDAFILDRLAKNPGTAKQPNMERHHIVPRCLKGSNTPSNLVSLSFSDHIFAHLLLAKIHGAKLAVAFVRMMGIGRYQGRHTRLVRAEIKRQADLLNPRRGKPQTPKQIAAIAAANERRQGQEMHPNLRAARKIQGEKRRGLPAHQNSIIAASRSGNDRTPAQIARNEMIANKRRGQPARPGTLEAIKKLADQRRGQPWSPVRRAAQEAKQLSA